MRRFAAAVTTLTMTVACGDTPTAPTNVGGWVPSYNGIPVAFAGRVLDNATGVGVPNAIVQFGLSIASRAALPPATTIADAAGSFTLKVPPGVYEASVGSAYVGRVRVTGFGSRGELFVNGGICESRYGVISDLLTGRPIAGARINGSLLLTDSEGWYRWNSCPPISFDFGTRAMSVSHPDYVFVQSLIIGRAFIGVSRLDIGLVRRARPTG
jgi:hypothetical protein